MTSDNNTLIEVSAFSGLAGAILSQTLTGLFTYFSDKRKAATELKKVYRDKQLEIAENFYYMTGETMTVLQKSITHWKDRNKARSELSVLFFNKEMKKLDTYLEKLKTEHWKHNLISLYFEVSLSYDELIAANHQSHSLYLELLDTSEKIKAANDEEKKLELISQYLIGVYDLCGQYEEIYAMLEKDMGSVKTELLRTFQVK
ncbi:MAG: hypothetical protein JWQ79_2859 [Mucilaginibacter sp.]|jgi:hypothetical protein|nr:hypothetical protein [Mucilaginibacter sp.]